MSYEKSILAYVIGLVVFVIIAIFAVLNLAGAFGSVDSSNFSESIRYDSNYFSLKMSSYSRDILEYMK